MKRILVSTSGPQDWQRLLADPEKHWKAGFSAHALAHCWEASNGFPEEVALPFAQCTHPLLQDLAMLQGIPEFKVPLPGGERPSQNDIFVLARSAVGLVSIMVEGKAMESFGPPLNEWYQNASPGKMERLSFILDTLGLSVLPHGKIRYQLLHRAASAIITGEQYHTTAAVLLVHSFSQERIGWDDYQEFTSLFGVEARIGCVQGLGTMSKVPFFGVWVVGNSRFGL